ncbi:MAG: hypothetical protein HYX68_09865 [Planctomycetes bacterium]|nr:hypothetical protein [Planctomycetota bacterium]
MSLRAAAIVWLLIAMFMGLITLLVVAGGAIAIWHTHDKVTVLEQKNKKNQDEANELEARARKGPVNFARLRDLRNMLEVDVPAANEARQERFYAIGVLISSVVPALMTLPFFTMFLVKWLKARAAAKKAAAKEEENAPPEPGPAKEQD